MKTITIQMTEVTIDDTVVTDFPKLEESIFYSVG